jgi:hypothetical protein
MEIWKRWQSFSVGGGNDLEEEVEFELSLKAGEKINFICQLSIPYRMWYPDYLVTY